MGLRTPRTPRRSYRSSSRRSGCYVFGLVIPCIVGLGVGIPWLVRRTDVLEGAWEWAVDTFPFAGGSHENENRSHSHTNATTSPVTTPGSVPFTLPGGGARRRQHLTAPSPERVTVPIPTLAPVLVPRNDNDNENDNDNDSHVDDNNMDDYDYFYDAPWTWNNNTFTPAPAPAPTPPLPSLAPSLVPPIHVISGVEWIPMGSKLRVSSSLSSSSSSSWTTSTSENAARFGSSVSLSRDGTVVAIGSPFHGSGGSVSVYKYDTQLNHNDWMLWGWNENDNVNVNDNDNVLVGGDGDRMGFSVSLSSDGYTLAVGSDLYDRTESTTMTPTTITDTGRVAVFRWVVHNEPQQQQQQQQLPSQPLHGWTQLTEWTGQAMGDRLGATVALSADGTRVAAGAPVGGYAVVLPVPLTKEEEDPNSWDISMVRMTTTTTTPTSGEGEANEWWEENTDTHTHTPSHFGASLDLSSDGSVLAVGAPRRGSVRIYRRTSQSQEGQGNDTSGSGSTDSHDHDHDTHSHTNNYEYVLEHEIVAESDGDWMGVSVSLSADGNRIAVGAPNNDGTTTTTHHQGQGQGTSRGHVRVFGYNEPATTTTTTSTKWTKVGRDIDGEAPGDGSGSAVSLSENGQRLAIGAKHNDGGGNDSGHIRVYGFEHSHWDDDDNDDDNDDDSVGRWVQLGRDLDGRGHGQWSGHSLALSADGTRLAVGEPGNDGRTGFVEILQMTIAKSTGLDSNNNEIDNDNNNNNNDKMRQ